MLQQIALGCPLMIATTVVHAGCMAAALTALRIHAQRSALRSQGLKVGLGAVLVLVMFLASLVETWPLARSPPLRL